VKRASILVVEDETIVAADIQQQLRQDGFRLNPIARSGEDAVRLAQELLPDLVLMDIRLAGSIDGLAAARLIQRSTGIPVVYLTAFPGMFLQDPSSMQDPNLCLIKPFAVSELRSIIDVALHPPAQDGNLAS
jgi:CheY-like chemotaxis protein